LGEFQIFNKIDQAEANANDAIGLIQTEEGALTETHSMLQRMTTLATQAANGTYSTAEEGQTARDAIQKEVDELSDEITRIAQNTKYNGLSPLDGKSDKSDTVTYSVVKNDALDIQATDSTNGTAIKGVAGNSYVVKTEAGKKSVVGTYSLTTDVKSAAEEKAKAMQDAESNSKITYTAMTKADFDASAAKDAAGKDGVTDANTYYIIKTDNTGATPAYTVTDTKISTDDLANTAKASLTNSDPITLQVGPTAGETLSVNQTDMTFAGLFGADNKTGDNAAETGLSTNVNQTVDGKKVLDMSTVDNANKAITSIKNAINTVSSYRADLGAKQNRLEHTINNLKTTNENVTAAESRIRDTDMAKEIASYTKNNILSQAAQSMLAQANQSGQGVLTLLRG
jgi:flagellin